ncbi:hypothetical protein [Methylosinus sp. LW4]|uniref:hypothetical protein n=1 Tax=Methylosinus sp. LW4 TaxID=136993 RepID=UPI0012FAA02C|nr:hypothetical protein [Methylosinus sp. LW4]
MAYENLIGLLELSDPDALAALRKRHPDAGALLSSSRALGGAEAKTIVDRAALVDIILTTSENVNTNAERLAREIYERMKLVSKVTFFGALVATLSGGLGALLAALGVASQWIGVVAPLASMLGGATSLLANQLERSPSGVRIAAWTEYSKLLEMMSQIELIRIQINRDDILRVPDERLASMAEQMDALALKIHRLQWL